MAASYNTILVPMVGREAMVAAIGDAMRRLGYEIVHREDLEGADARFQFRSVEFVFGGPSDDSRWIPLSSWGDGIVCPWPDWYRDNPIAKSLSHSLSPVVYHFTHNGGLVAGYCIFQNGRLVEAQSLMSRPEWSLDEFEPRSPRPISPSLLAELVGESEFEFESFMRGYACLEIAMAALAARLGVFPHLIDPLDIQDGDGALVVDEGELRNVSLSGWFGVYYKKIAQI